MRLLVADDDLTCREIAYHLLTRAGHAVTLVADGAAARDALLHAPFAAAFLDLQMPVLDGAEVAQAIRAALPANRRPRLIALSAATDPGDEARFAALGFDACLGKPIRAAALLAALDAGTAAAAPIVAPAIVPPGSACPLPLPLAPPDPTDMAQVAAYARALIGSPAALEQPQLAGLCARLAAAAANGERASVAELLAALQAL